jgi:mono/diheme cytochrome c family protein
MAAAEPFPSSIETTMQFAIALLLLGISAPGARADALAERGRALVQEMCAGCHAVDRGGVSPHPAAPAFSRLVRQLDFETFPQRLRRGPIAGHPDMPSFRFSQDAARAVVAYLRSLRAP